MYLTTANFEYNETVEGFRIGSSVRLRQTIRGQGTATFLQRVRGFVRLMLLKLKFPIGYVASQLIGYTIRFGWTPINENSAGAWHSNNRYVYTD